MLPNVGSGRGSACIAIDALVSGHSVCSAEGVVIFDVVVVHIVLVIFLQHYIRDQRMFFDKSKKDLNTIHHGGLNGRILCSREQIDARIFQMRCGINPPNYFVSGRKNLGRKRTWKMRSYPWY